MARMRNVSGPAPRHGATSSDPLADVASNATACSSRQTRPSRGSCGAVRHSICPCPIDPACTHLLALALFCRALMLAARPTILGGRWRAEALLVQSIPCQLIARSSQHGTVPIGPTTPSKFSFESPAATLVEVLVSVSDHTPSNSKDFAAANSAVPPLTSLECAL